MILILGGGQSGGRNQLRYAHAYLKILKKYLKTGRVIDVGSSTNPFPNLAKDANFDVTVMDFVKSKNLHPEISFYSGNLDHENCCNASADKYDAVTAWAVLEHTRNPKHACRMLSNMCKTGGLVVISTPEIGTFFTRHSIGRSRWFCPPEHLHLISPEAIKLIFDQCDCELIRWGRLELGPLRWAIRYGIGLMETISGLVLKHTRYSYWERLRLLKMQRFMGRTFFILRKRS